MICRKTLVLILLIQGPWFVDGSPGSPFAASGLAPVDCNSNGISDECDISCGCPGGPCDLIPLCGTLDDCNVNGIPDDCDITSDPSLDIDGDGVLDACITAAPVGVSNWTDSSIWGLTPGQYPDNINSASGLSVTLPPSATINLDTSVEIEGLRLGQGAILNVTDPTDGDLTIRQASGGGIRSEGEIQVSLNRKIQVVGGIFDLVGAGRYVGEAAGTVPVTVVLEVKGVVLHETLCGATDQMTLIKNMKVITSQDFVMDATGCALCVSAGGRTSAPLGGKTPPILRLRPPRTSLSAGRSSVPGASELTQLVVGRTFQMLDAAEVCVGCDMEAGAPTPNVELHGDFDNQSVRPSLFDWNRGKLTLPSPVSASLQAFEVGGIDLGATAEGFDTNADAVSDTNRHRNFSMGTIEVQTDAQVSFVNNRTNTVGTGAGEEALYVNTLILRQNASVALGDSNVYYCDLVDEGATIQLNGSGALVALDCPGPVPAVSHWGLAALALLLLGAGAVVMRRRALVVRRGSAA